MSRSSSPYRAQPRSLPTENFDINSTASNTSVNHPLLKKAYDSIGKGYMILYLIL